MTVSYDPADGGHASLVTDLGISDLERLLCGPEAIGSIDRLIPRATDAWTVQFSDLRSLPGPDRPFRPLKVCVATEDIAGPVRNGGIGTTYAALAELLSQLGHDTTILYLKGSEVETESIDHWINFYAEKGVRFVPVPNYAAADQFRTTSDRWLQAPYNMLRYLLANPMDVVHVSEWRGSAYLSLLAKRQGLAFKRTLFIVKTSSPWMWNRLYGSQPLERIDDLAKVHAERRSVELADMVIGGSLHLLRWMASQGYDIPRPRTFVQPNVASFDKLAPLMHTRAITPGARVPIDEIVFFGRLEARKGLFIFCQAIKRLIRMGVPLPPKISFMGKPGAKLTARPDQAILGYIEEETKAWPTQVQVLTDFQQYEAIEYLLGGTRLAVMPSVIENSSMAVYEAAICRIPCIATAVGGNAELIDRADWEHVLCEPHPVALGDKLKAAIEDGGYVPRPSFDNDANLETWRAFHRALGGGLWERLTAGGHDEAPAPSGASISVCVYFTGREEALRATLESLRDQEIAPGEVIVAVDADEMDALARAHGIAEAMAFPVRLIEAFDLDAGGAFNRMAEAAEGHFLLFLWEGAILAPAGLGALSKVAASSGAQVLNYFYRVASPGSRQADRTILKALVVGSTTDAFFRNDATELPLFVTRETFQRLGGFTTDYRVLCHDYEFVLKAQLAGVACETALLELGSVEAWDPEWLSRKGYDLATSNFRAIRPKLAASPLGVRDLLLASKGLQVRGGAQRGWKRPQEVEAGRQVEGLLGRMMESTLSEPAGRDGSTRSEAGRSELGRAKRKRSVGLLGLLEAHHDEIARPPSSSRMRPADSPVGPFSALAAVEGAVAEGNLFGRLMAVHDEKLYGWACDAGAMQRSLHVQAEVDGKTSVQLAAHTLPAWSGVPKEVRRHGFVLPLPKAWTARLRRSEPRALTLRIADSGLVLAHKLWLPAKGAILSGSDVEGYCDASDNGVVYGWAWRPGTPDKLVEVAIFIDGELLIRMRADRYRDDLRHRGVGDGEHGFNVTLPKGVTAQGAHRIDVVVAETGLALLRSPMTSQGRLIQVHTPAKRRRWRS